MRGIEVIVYPGVACPTLCVNATFVRNQVLHRLVRLLNDYFHSLYLVLYFFSHNRTNLVLRGKHFHHLIYVLVAQHIASIVSLMWIECATRTRDPLKAVNQCGSCRGERQWLLSRWGSQACGP